MKRIWSIILIVLPVISIILCSDILAQAKTLTVDMQYCDIRLIPMQYYTGIAIEPELHIYYDGQELKKDIDYTTVYSSNVNEGTAFASITGKGKFSGTQNTTFEIVIPNSDSDFVCVSYAEDKLLLCAYLGTSSKVVVPSKIDGKTVYAVGKEAFSGNQNIEEVYLPETVEVLEYCAFFNCRNLKKVNLGSLQQSLEHHGLSEMLSYCSRLECIEMSDSANLGIPRSPGIKTNL